MVNVTKRAGFFTLMECVTALAVMAALAGTAIPLFFMQAEKARTGEGLQTLEALYKAQRSHYNEYRVYTNNIANLDVQIRLSNYYNAPVLSATDPIISLPRNNNSYTLTMTSAGVRGCTPAGGYCGNLGF